VDEDGRVSKMSFKNVPSFGYLQHQKLSMPHLREVEFDTAFGGAFYAIVDAEPLGLTLNPDNYPEIIRYGRAIKHTILTSQIEIAHPFEPDPSSLFGVIFTDPALDP
jgi:proline racemase